LNLLTKFKIERNSVDFSEPFKIILGRRSSWEKVRVTIEEKLKIGFHEVDPYSLRLCLIKSSMKTRHASPSFLLKQERPWL